MILPSLLQTAPILSLQSISRNVADNRDLKIVVYGKRLTPDTLLAIKIKSLTVKYITYRIYSKYRKLRKRHHI